VKQIISTVAVFTLLVAGAAWLSARPVATPAGAGEWPQWRGPNRDAVSADTGLLKQWADGGPPLAWKASGIGTGLSSVSLAGGRIFTMGDLGDTQYVFALSQQDGKILWRAQVGPAWREQYGGPRGTPTVDGDLLYAIGTDGDLVCLETATGKERWRKSLTRDFAGYMMSVWAFSESPLVDGDKLLFTPGGNRAAIVAVNKGSGQELWRAQVPPLGPNGKDGAGYSSMVISNGGGMRQYVQLTGRGLVSVRASDGKFLWGYNNIANRTANIPTPLVRGDYVFGATGYGAGAALLKLSKDGDGVRAEEVYFHPGNVLQNHHGGFVLVGDYLYAGHGHNQGFPVCLEFLTGKILWGPLRNNGRNSAAVVYADGNLYFRYQSGLVVLIEATPEGYKEKGSFQIPNVNHPSWPHPVVVGGKLYLREQDTLYVYNVRG
jgi:outer membrane protein assembly factor BamB